MTIKIHPICKQEIKDIRKIYRKHSKKLPIKFTESTKDALLRIADHPHAWAKHIGKARRIMCQKFDYGFLYVTKPDHIFVYALIYLKGDPDKSFEDRIDV